jgi:hypothetical protein
MDLFSVLDLGDAILRDNGLVGWTFRVNTCLRPCTFCHKSKKRIEVSERVIDGKSQSAIEEVLAGLVERARG